MYNKRIWISLLGLSLLLAGLSACSSGSSGISEAVPEDATVNGRLLDDYDSPIADALVRFFSDPIETLTDSDGNFSFTIVAGAHQLVASKDGLTLAVMCITAAEGVIYDLGDIKPGTPSNCNTGTPSAGDADGDGLQDSDEIAGWSVSIALGDSALETRMVDSDPALYDTDGDGLNDAQEMAARTDPRRIDTDGDLLSDYAELNVYKSHPAKMDSDGDSCDPGSAEGECDSDPNLWDGYELALSKTSPTLADTDGDGLSDYQEINVGGTHPLIADLPSLSLELNGEPSIILNITDTSDETNTEVSSSLKSNKSEQKNSSKASTDLTISNTTKIHAEAEAGTGKKWPPSASVKATNDTSITAAFSLQTDASWDKDSVQQTKDTYDTEVVKKTTVSLNDGMLWVAIKLKNHSSLAFKLKDLKVIAYRMEPGGSFSTVGILLPGYKSVDGDRNVWVREDLCADPNDSASCGRVLGPSDELSLVIGVDALPAQIMRALVENPTALRFEVATYSLFQLDEFGVNETVNYAKLNESVVQRCGLLAVDYGDGEVLNKMVAANVYRNPDGSGRGVTMREALSNIVGLDYATLRVAGSETLPGSEVLYRIKNTRAYDKCDTSSDNYDATEDCTNLHKMALWLVGGSDRQFDDNAPPVDFNKLVLKNDEQINLVYLQDSDGEGIFDREEYLLGSDKTLPDSDYEGLSDYDEAKVGWQVAVSGITPYVVYPDPRFTDADNDAISDSGEQGLGTDPYKADTDGDGDNDFLDVDPLNPPCLKPIMIGLLSWWDGSIDTDGMVVDVMGNNRGTLVNGAESLPLNDDAVFALNRDINNINDQYINIPNSTIIDAHNNVYTFSARIFWNGTSSTADAGTILAKGSYADETYAMFIYDDEHLHHVLKRHYYQDNSWLVGDIDEDRRSTFNTASGIVPRGEWVQVVGTFDKTWARTYVDGVEVASQSLLGTTKLVTNSAPLTIGQRYGSNLPFSGMMDDIQFFDRALNSEQVRLLNKIGVCAPQPASP